MKIVSWQPVLTDHQSWTLEALQVATGCEFEIHVLQASHAERRAQGWLNAHADALKPTVLPPRRTFLQALRIIREARDAVHVFGSPFERLSLILVLCTAVAMGRRVYLVSEPYSPISAGYQSDSRGLLNRLKSRLRPLAYSLYGCLLSKRISGVFAISRLSAEQYRRIGVPTSRIFPFGYFIPRQIGLPEAPRERADEGGFTLRAVFVGNLIARKGLDLLVAAIRDLRSQGVAVTLDAYGPGDPAPFGFDEAAIRYRGAVSFGQAQRVISEYDVLILPSRFDGWGVVVNEALLAGVPVICSDAVGAGDLLTQWDCGARFRSEDVSDLGRTLRSFATIDRLAALRRGVRPAAEAILPSVAGQYMAEAIHRGPAGPKPKCPWYDCL
jgi:glycosyltransferase involved in cell wall biosynthesis